MASERVRIGILFSNNPLWIGGTYYITNLVSALCTLAEEDKPELIVLANSRSDYEMLVSTGYPYLSFKSLDVRYSVFDRVINKVSRVLSGRNIIDKKYKDAQLDLVFPYFNSYSISAITNRLYWIPDFQVNYYPRFFSKEERELRIGSNRAIAESKYPVVFSSGTAKADFCKFYDASARRNQFVMPFAVSHPSFKEIDLPGLLEKYTIGSGYFFSPNQFWIHKNHMVVLKAIKLLKDQGLDLLVVFTGKEDDPRNPGYFEELGAFVSENEIAENVKFLGFIDRKEQLKLMDAALAVIQPSLFEGWSTVVEDAKAMDQYVFLSDIPVHREQMSQNVSFFDPMDEKSLAELMKIGLSKPPLRIKQDYTENIQRFALEFSKIVRDVTSR